MQNAFFYVSKIAWYLLEPLNALILIQLVALGCLWRKRVRLAAWLFTLSVATMIAVAALPIPEMLLQPLEQRFPVLEKLPEKVDGIVLLTGGQDPALTRAYGKAYLVQAGAPTTTFVTLARQFPMAKLVVTGGSGQLRREVLSEAEVVHMFAREQGIEPARLLVEDQSRNTRENALHSHRVAQPRAGETWLLVTRAYHMPRAVGAFRKAGWNVTPFPAGFRLPPGEAPMDKSVVAKFLLLSAAIHEWIGIGAYRFNDWI